MSNIKKQIHLDSIAGIHQLDDVSASQCRGGLSLSITAEAGESAAGATTGNKKAQAGNGEVSFDGIIAGTEGGTAKVAALAFIPSKAGNGEVSFNDNATPPSFNKFPKIFGNFSFIFPT